MANTKHRNIRVDENNTKYDEEEQRMHVKDYRNRKLNTLPEIDEEEIEESPYGEDIEFLMKRMR